MTGSSDSENRSDLSDKDGDLSSTMKAAAMQRTHETTAKQTSCVDRRIVGLTLTKPFHRIMHLNMLRSANSSFSTYKNI